MLEGPRAVEEALGRGIALDSLYLGQGAELAFADLVGRAQDAGTPIFELKEGVLEKVGTTRTPQPVLAIAPTQPRIELDALQGPLPVVVVVGVSDPGNLGTLLRSAEAAGCAGIVCAGQTVDVYNPKVVRASAGSVFGVAVVEAGEPVEVLDALGSLGWRRCGAVATGGTTYDRADLAGRVALVVGNEAHGLPDAVLHRLDERLTIPMQAGVESLNVAVAAGLLLFETARQRRA